MHSLITIVIPFDSGRSKEVDAVLDGFGNPARGAIADALNEAAFVHFLSICVIPPSSSAQAHLVIEASADGGREMALRYLVKAIGPQLTELLTTTGVPFTPTEFDGFLRKHTLKLGQCWFSVTGLDYDGTPDMMVWRIRGEAALARAIADMLAADPPTGSARDTLQRIRAKLWEDGRWKWTFVAEPAALLSGAPTGGRMRHVLCNFIPLLAAASVSFLWPFWLVLGLVLLLGWWLWGLATAAWLVTFLFVLGGISLLVGVVRLRRLEKRDVPDDEEPRAAHIAEIMRRENFGAQNHLAAVSTLKPERFRRLTLRIGLWAAGQIAIHSSRPSFLATTGVIHFARWVVLPGTDKLLFFSNYDGAWESYLEDFIQKASQGVSAIWSNTRGFPRTSFLFNGGAADGNRLRRWTRRQQFPTRFWYSAYPDLTLDRIRLNAAVRQGLACAQTEMEATDWLSCFGSAPKPPARLETDEIQTLAFGGLRSLHHSRCLLVVMSEDAINIRAWLEGIRQRITFGEARDIDKATLIGLKQTAFEKLGLHDALTTFPVAFQHGSQAPWRAHLMGDTGANAPENWLWGCPGCDVDAVVLLYADSQPKLEDMTNRCCDELRALGHRVGSRIDLTPLNPLPAPVRENFGFIDGISNPLIRGTSKCARRRSQPQTVVDAGEFVLGYPDNSGTLPCTPTVAAAQDPKGILQTFPRDPFRQRPDFTSPQTTGQHDLGQNGSYLVVRELAQDVQAFWRMCESIADDLAKRRLLPPLHGVAPEEWVAAKMVGRWKDDGGSLVRYPRKPGGRKPDNDFLFGAEDPDGMRCPFGAHIRRANPRDTFAPGSELQLAITNRHRLLRVGRPYQAQNEREKPGILFMCLNTDIDRQFEFVQQTWLFGRSFNGLPDEVDPVLRNSTLPDVFTIPTGSCPVRVYGLQDCVRVLGSGYFFMPGRRALRFLASAP